MMDLSEVVDRTLRGFIKAQKQYERLSGGWWLWRTNEYVATVNIAESLHKVAYVTIEQNIAQALDWAGKPRNAPRGKLPPGGRFDLVVWGEGDEGIKGIVEVKMTTGLTYGTVSKDVARVCEALRQAKDLEWGLVAFHSTIWDGVGEKPKPACYRLQARSDNIKAKAMAYAAGKGIGFEHHVGDLVVDGDCACRAEVLTFTAAR